MSRRFGSLAAVLLVSAAAARGASLTGQMREVERLRQLKFLHPVAERTIDRSDLPALLKEQLASSVPYSLQEYARVLQALQLIHTSSGAVDQMLKLYDSQVLAFYDPLSHTYFAIRELPAAIAGVPTAGALGDSVVLHELTHALQDQRFDAGARDRALLHDTDGELAYHALLEGEATLVMLESLIDTTGQSFDQAVKSGMLLDAMNAGTMTNAMIGKDIPRYFVESLKFPYIEGLKLVIDGYERGGWTEVDRMDENPPRTTREVLHPSEYFARLERGEPGAPPFDPPPVPGIITTERLGEFHWRFLVGDAATGWVDDRVTFACNGIVHVHTRWESPARADAFREAYVSFLYHRGIEPRVTSHGDDVDVVYLP